MIQHRIKEREPQYMDMKEIITEAARKLVLEKKVKKLTVKDIVEECQITRQAFYYHFEGIPDMIQWSIKQGTRRLLEACKEQGGAEAARRRSSAEVSVCFCHQCYTRSAKRNRK